MNLKKKIKVKTYWVIAEYKVKKEHTPMLAILKAINELMMDKEYINAKMLFEHLLYPLSEQATENLLLRLKDMNYLRKHSYLNEDDNWEDDFEEESKGYILSELGRDAVRNNSYYEQQKGVLKIQITDKNDFVLQEIIKIEPSGKDIKDIKDARVEELPSFIINGLVKPGKKYVLNDGEYILDKIEKKGIVDDEKDIFLDVKLDKKGSTAKVLNYENHDDSWTEKLVKKELLRNEFGQNYMPNKNLVKVPFDKFKVMLSRTETIAKPKVGATDFEALKLDVNVSPRNSEEAEWWYLEALKQEILNSAYFLSEAEFQQCANDLAKKFILFEEELMGKFSRTTVLEKFGQKDDFYTRAKLETIDYLNY